MFVTKDEAGEGVVVVDESVVHILSLHVEQELRQLNTSFTTLTAVSLLQLQAIVGLKH